MIAAERGYTKVVDFLTSSGADMDLKNEVLCKRNLSNQTHSD